MKILNVLSHTNIILEAEEDLFPGIGSSALDVEKQPDTIESLIALGERNHDMAQVYEKQYYAILYKLDDNDALNDAPYEHSVKKNEESYDAFDWIVKYKHARSALEETSISKESPLFNDIERYIRLLDKCRERMGFYEAQKDELYQRRLKVLELQNENT